MTVPSVRALCAADADGARALLQEILGGTPHESRAVELLADAVHGRDGERAFVAVDKLRGFLSGVALVGMVAGARQVAKLHLIAARSRSLHERLATAAVHAMSANGVRLAVAEVPCHALFDEMCAALHAVGFAEEGRVGEWFDEGTALRILVARAPFDVVPRR